MISELRWCNGVLQWLAVTPMPNTYPCIEETMWRDVPRADQMDAIMAIEAGRMAAQPKAVLTPSIQPLLEGALIGSAWRTRNGLRVLVVRHCPDKLVDVKFDAVSGSHTGTCYANGRFSSEIETPSDLVEPWPMPRISQKPDIDARIKVLETQYTRPFTYIHRCYRGNGPEWSLQIMQPTDTDLSGKCYYGDSIESVLSQAEADTVKP